MKYLLLIIFIFTSCSLTPQKRTFKASGEITGDNSKLYKLELTEKGLKRVKLAITAFEKGVEYERGWKYNEVLFLVIGGVLVGSFAGFVGGYQLGGN